MTGSVYVCVCAFAIGDTELLISHHDYQAMSIPRDDPFVPIGDVFLARATAILSQRCQKNAESAQLHVLDVPYADHACSLKTEAGSQMLDTGYWINAEGPVWERARRRMANERKGRGRSALSKALSGLNKPSLLDPLPSDRRDPQG